jgi:hypothetical protein
METNPIYYNLSNHYGVATADEDVVDRLRGLLANGAQATIWPSSLFQTVRRPKSILKCNPSVRFDFWRSPSIPNPLVQIGGN